MFDAGSRAVFRDTLDLDDATWERGRGWTLWKALIILSGISETNAVEAERSLETAREILAD
jgi:aminoglycoside phosphotransferase (APT) family kinase protein